MNELSSIKLAAKTTKLRNRMTQVVNRLDPELASTVLGYWDYALLKLEGVAAAAEKVAEATSSSKEN